MNNAVIAPAAHGFFNRDYALALFHNRSGICVAARAFFNRQRFARHDGLIHGRLARYDLSVDGDGLAGQHAQQVAARDLVRGLAHEIKNPLGGLRGAAQLLSKALPDPALTEYTKVIIEQADRLRNLVDRLLGPQHPGMHVTESIHKVAERVVKLVSMELPDNVKLIRDYDPSLPELPHDPDQIEQVLLNIVRNALQALGPEGGEIVLRTRTAFQLTLHGVRYRLAARIDVEDNGPGIPPQLQDTLFYPMVSGREGGTGLGLSIARSLIDQHSGKIEFTSWPGHTEFSVYLPIRK